jgi:hypothetical protein
LRLRGAALAIIVASAGAAVPALSLTVAPLFSSTRGFSLDGERYVLERSGEGDFSLVRRELARSGIRVPPFEADIPPHPALAFALRREGRETVRWRNRLPAGFEIRHSLVLHSPEGPVGISFGASAQRYDASRRRLAANGWTCDELEGGGKRRCLATRSSGKESTLVFLEEEEGRFLAVRRLER